MKAFSLAIVVLWCALASAPCFAKSPDSKAASASADHALPESDFRPLFDGKTLTGWWQHNGVPEFHRGGKWEVIGGNIVGIQYPPDRGGFLATKEKFGDFILRFEVKLDYPTDSGVFVRMGEDGKSHQVTLDNRPDGDFGAIYLPWTQASVKKNPEGIKHFKQKAWNTGEIRIEGEPSRIRFWLNGDLVQDFQHTAKTTKDVPRSGYIGLQVHPTVTTHVNYKEGNQVRYRNIRIHSLDADKSKDATNSKSKTNASPN
jgi:Domain of Unknown Function (DUF1080)